MSVKEKMTALADEIRAKTGKEEAMSIETMAENINEVYTAGAKSEYDAFWDNYQDNGKRGNYNYAFYGHGWNDKNFIPKYDICPTSSGSTVTMMFAYSEITDLVQILEKCGVKLNLTYVSTNSLVNLFRESKIIRLPEINIPNVGGFGEYCFYKCLYLTTIDKLVVKEGQVISENSFRECTSLNNIIIDGVVISDFDIHWSPLSKDSILSIFTALSDTSESKTVSFSLSAINEAFETEEGVKDGGTSDEWNDLLKTKVNWTVVLV